MCNSKSQINLILKRHVSQLHVHRWQWQCKTAIAGVLFSVQPFIVRLHCAPSYCNQHLAQYWFITKLQISLPCSLCAPQHQRSANTFLASAAFRPTEEHYITAHFHIIKKKTLLGSFSQHLGMDLPICDYPFWEKKEGTPTQNQNWNNHMLSFRERCHFWAEDSDNPARKTAQKSAWVLKRPREGGLHYLNLQLCRISSMRLSPLYSLLSSFQQPLYKMSSFQSTPPVHSIFCMNI